MSVHGAMQIGYARVSTDEQNLALQLDALRQAGCEQIFQDVASGATTKRQGLSGAIVRCSQGDVLVVWKLDRLGRSLIDLIGLVEKLNASGIGLKVLAGHGSMIDTTRAEGRMMFGLLAVLAEFERDLIRERTRAGMASARARGKRIGRPAKLSDAEVIEAKSLVRAEAASLGELAEAYGVAPITLARALKRRPADVS